MRRKRNPILFYLGFYGRYRLKLAGMGGLYVVKHGTAMMFPLILRHVIDVLIPASDLKGVFMCIPLVLGLVLVNLVCHSPFTMIASDIIKSVSRDLRSLIIHKLQILSLVFIKGSDTGRFYSKIMVDVTRAEDMGRQLFVNVAGTLLTLAYSITILSLVNAKMTALFLVSVPVYGAVYWFFKSRFRRYQHQARMADEDLSQSVNQFIQTSTLARVHGEEDFEHKKIDKLGSRIVEKYKKVQFNVGAFNILVYGTSQIFQITVVAFSALAIMRGHMSIGDLVVFAQYMQMILNALSTIMNQVPVFVQGAESIRSIEEVLGSPQTEDNEGKKLLEDIRGDISFRNVSFTYGMDKPALHGVTIDIPAGKTVALAGSSGSGKSTFVSIALGLIRPDSGSVTIDGHDVNSLDMRAVRKQVGVVTQDPILFKATVAENIAHARKTIDMNEVREAARQAHAHDFIMELENGYDTVIGEQGATLSGGQKQRIAIARAILRKPRILVLDEATSALDSVSEKEVQKGIDNLLGSQTALTIAHRLATIRNADTILVFDQGRIVEQGNHDELLAVQGVYAGMYRMQAG